jgi:hypothetical protein
MPPQPENKNVLPIHPDIKDHLLSNNEDQAQKKNYILKRLYNPGSLNHENALTGKTAKP